MRRCDTILCVVMITERGNQMYIDLKGMRQKRGWTQKELSERSEVPQPMISDIESGKVSNPTVGTLIKLAHAMRCAIEDMILDEKVV